MDLPISALIGVCVSIGCFVQSLFDKQYDINHKLLFFAIVILWITKIYPKGIL